ncbi:MAG: ABC transporter permease [Planctomycetes bacterium]|nr:ABC transporter permease [Planctomycetota bacterium]
MSIPLSYNLRSLFVRKSATALTVLGIGATVAIFAGVLALQQGFVTMLSGKGREDVAVFLRPGATGETDSQFRRDLGLKLIKQTPEIEQGPGGPLASMECYFAALKPRMDGGSVNVPMRGVQPTTFEIREGEIRIVEGRNFTPGADEVIVGRKLTDRIQNCRVGDVLQLNTTPYKVVGVFDHDGGFASEVWGDLDRFLATLDRYGPNRVIAKLSPGTVIGDPEAEGGAAPGSLSARLADDTEVPAKVMSEKQFLLSQTRMLGGVLSFLGLALASVMGIGAVLTAINTMLAAISARTSEIGILLSIGYRPFPIFIAFFLESIVLCLLGGVAGCLMALPFNGIETGTMNGNTFSEVAFAFRVDAQVLTQAVIFSLVLGVLGGLWPALRACRMTPTQALRRA